MSNKKVDIKFADLFCGGGFGARGATMAGAKPVLALDSWNIATETYRANFPEADIINQRIEEVDPSNLDKKYLIDVLLTSPECTSHSIARGAKTGCEKSRETALGIVPWIHAMKPRWVVVENVNRMKQWSRHNELVTTIEANGYTVSDLYMNSADFGSAQARKRMFLICDRKGSEVTVEELKSLAKKQTLVARDVIDWSGKYKSTPLYTEKRAHATLQRAERAMASLGRNKPFIIVYYGSDYAGGWQSLDAPLRTITTIDRFGLVTWSDNIPFLRMLQPDELLQAMGAGPEHTLPVGNRREKVKLCGNGVCSDVVATIFKWIKLQHNCELDQIRDIQVA